MFHSYQSYIFSFVLIRAQFWILRDLRSPVMFCPCVICAPHIWPHLASVQVIFLHFNSQAKGSERSNMIFVAWTLCSWWLCYTIAPIQYQLLWFNINCSNSIWNEISIETSPAPSHPSSGRPTEIRNKSESPIRDHSADRDQNPQIDWSQDFKACLFHKSSKPSDYATIGNSGWEKKRMLIYAFRVHAA